MWLVHTQRKKFNKIENKPLRYLVIEYLCNSRKQQKKKERSTNKNFKIICKTLYQKTKIPPFKPTEKINANKSVEFKDAFAVVAVFFYFSI